MQDAPASDINLLKLTFLREVLQAAPDPEAEAFPLMELAASIVEAAMTRETLLRRTGLLLD